MRYMYLKCILRGTYLRCRIHAGYMRDTCGIHVSARVSEYMGDTSKKHDGKHVPQMYLERYVSEMQDTCGIHAGYMRDTYLGGLGECIDAIMESK